MYSVTIIGIGRVGSAFARTLRSSNYLIDHLVVRNSDQWVGGNDPSAFDLQVVDISELQEISSDIVLISTQDSEIAKVVREIVPLVAAASHVFHTSGSLSSDVLEPLGRRGCGVGSIHPLVSVAKGENAGECFRGAYFCVEGDEKGVAIANTVVKDIGGRPFTIDADKKSLYHASAVMACGHLVALLDSSVEMIRQCGVDEQFASQIMMPLVASTISNLNRMSPAEALTGPFARGDLRTVERHLAVFEALPDRRLLEIYVVLGDRSLDLAASRGLDAAVVGRIRERISLAKSEGKC